MPMQFLSLNIKAKQNCLPNFVSKHCDTGKQTVSMDTKVKKLRSILRHLGTQLIIIIIPYSYNQTFLTPYTHHLLHTLKSNNDFSPNIGPEPIPVTVSRKQGIVC